MKKPLVQPLVMILLLASLPVLFIGNPRVSAQAVGVKVGDWVKYSVTGTYSGFTGVDWLKIEVTNVDGANVTVRTTERLLNGTEPSPQDTVLTVGSWQGGLAGVGLIIPADSKVGDTVYLFGLAIGITQETVRTYGGMSRIVVGISASFPGTVSANAFWDQATGMLLEVSMSYTGQSLSISASSASLWAGAPGPTQPPTTEWTRTYGGPNADEAKSVIQTSDGGYALAGSTRSFGHGGSDVWLVKTSAAGDVLWNQAYGSAADEWGYQVVQASDGSYAVVGTRWNQTRSAADLFMVKTNASGDLVWDLDYIPSSSGGSANWGDVGHIIQANDGSFILCGSVRDHPLHPTYDWDAWVIKVSGSGQVLWDKPYFSSSDDGGGGIIQTSDGGYAFVGATLSWGGSGGKIWLVKIDANGNQQWIRTYAGGGGPTDNAFSVVQTPDGGYALAGYTYSLGAAGCDFCLIKTDSLGNQAWAKTYGGSGDEQARSMIHTGDGGYLLAGSTNSFGAGGYDFWLVQVDSVGSMVWNKTCGGSSDDQAYSVIQTTDGGYALAGCTHSFGAGSSDFWLVKLASSGRAPKIWIVAKTGQADFSTIQEAVDAASADDTVFVRNGTYLEHLTIDKALILKGEDNIATRIDAGGTDPGSVVVVAANNVTITGFTIQNSRSGGNAIWIDDYVNCTISGNIITNNGDGIRILHSYGNTISDNIVEDNPYTSIGFDWAHDNIVFNNTIRNNYIGVGAGNPSYNNTFSNNTISGNSYGLLIAVYDSKFFHNSIMNNSVQAAFYDPSYTNTWDDGYPGGGNYWSDYKGLDLCSGPHQNLTGGDGIGDTPYIINAKNQDNYPLVNRLKPPPSNEPSVKWSVRYYGATPVDVAPNMVIQTSDGGYALAGTTSSFGHGARDFWLVKTDPNGVMQWNKTYGGAGNDDLYSVIQTNDGGYALAGATTSFGAGWYDFWLVKTDASGNMQWSKTYGGGGWDSAQSVIQTNDGGYAIAGWTYSFGAGADDFWLVKTDANGNMQWSRTYGGPSYEYAYSVIQTNDGGYAVAGFTSSFDVGHGSRDFWLVKTDANGIMQWNKAYGGRDVEDAQSMIQTTDGGYALAGDTYSFGAGGDDFYLVKTDVNGNMLWNKTYGGTGNELASSIVQTDDGGYALDGFTSSFGAGSNDFWLIRTHANGDMQWNQTYGGTGNDKAGSVVRTHDGGYALAGYTNSFSGDGSYEAWLIKLAPTSPLPKQPVANFTWSPSEPVMGEQVAFDGTSSQQGWNGTNPMPISMYQWDFGDGSMATGQIATHTYLGSGNFTVTLNVTAGQGLWNSTQKKIEVGQPRGPKAEFTATPGVARIGDIVELNASTSLPGWNGTYPTPITEYLWDFGDGNITSTSVSTIAHVYMSPGTFNATLTVFDTEGLNSSYSLNVLTLVPTFVSVSASSTSTVVGSAVDINGTLYDIYGNGLADESVVLYYTFAGVNQWYPMTSSITDSLGHYAAQWIPTATGTFKIKAEWAGNETYSGTSSNVTLGSVALMNQYIFTTESNSTVSALAFNITSSELDFTVSGPSGTTGYVKLVIAKSLVDNATNIKVYVDGNQTEYSIASVGDTWLLTFSYSHSTHQVAVNLGAIIVSEFPAIFVLQLLITTPTLLALVAFRRKRIMPSRK